MSPDSKHHVVIVGGGFAGLSAARGLARAPVRITLIDRCNHHLFQPLLYQVATAGLSAPAIAAPLRQILRRQENVTVLMGNVATINPDKKRIVLRDGGKETYDSLVLAPGAIETYLGHAAWGEFAPGLKTLDDALLIRRRILLAFEEAERESNPVRRVEWLSFAVIGGGPTGVELAGTLAEIARHTLRHEFRRSDPAAAQVRLIEAGPRILPTFDPRLSMKAHRQLVRLGVDVHTGAAVTSIDASGFEIGGKRIAARTVLWAAGVAASPLGRQLGTQTDAAGRVHLAPDLSVPGHPEIFVAGDLALVESNGRRVPGIASAAKQMGKHVARSILCRLSGARAPDFRYVDLGMLSTVGRMAAVAEFGPLKISGLLAWWIWLAAHIYFLIGFRNRLVVMIDWAWAYLTYARHARIIVGASPNGRQRGGV